MKIKISNQQQIQNALFQEFSKKEKKWRLLDSNNYNHPWLKLDLSRINSDISSLPLANSMHPLGKYINNLLEASNSQIGYGGWQEDRSLYEASPHFDQGTYSRSIHLGIDLWFPSGTPIFCPYPARIHSFKNNANFLDYGPTIILEHQAILEHRVSSELKFYSLYGHLSLDSLKNKAVGQEFMQGERLATLGAPPENGDWPAHLHFQIILDLIDNNGDFPGVSNKENQEFYRCICPDPSSLIIP